VQPNKRLKPPDKRLKLTAALSREPSIWFACNFDRALGGTVVKEATMRSGIPGIVP